MAESPTERIDHLERELAAARGRVASLQRQLDQEAGYLRDVQRESQGLRLLTGDGPAIRQVRQTMKQVAGTDATVLILGETGTGKELVARGIHQLSARHRKLFVALNAAALAPSLLASELFGHEAGAFTGAIKTRPGRFELAHGGTLFLDEVGELPVEAQALLLRVLQERTLERVGGNEPIGVDVRLVAATHRHLPDEIAAGRFRADLFYRLNVVPIHLPPLRDRLADLPALVRHFVLRSCARLGREPLTVGAAVLETLASYSWPGNVRELEHLIERAVVLATGTTLEVDPGWLRAPALSPSARSGSLADAERQAILAALAQARGRIYGPTGAAQALKLKPTTLYSKLRRLGLHRDAWQPPVA